MRHAQHRLIAVHAHMCKACANLTGLSYLRPAKLHGKGNRRGVAVRCDQHAFAMATHSSRPMAAQRTHKSTTISRKRAQAQHERAAVRAHALGSWGTATPEALRGPHTHEGRQ